MYQLKKGKEGFTMVEGPFKGRFEPGKSYDKIPPGMAGSFTEIKKAAAPVAKPAKADVGANNDSPVLTTAKRGGNKS